MAETSFRASAYSPNERYDIFRESMGCVFDVDRPTRKGADFDAKLDTLMFGECAFIRTETVGHTWSRTESKIASDGIDHILIQFFLDGFNDVRSGEGGMVSNEDLLIIDTAQPFEATTSDFANVTLVVPRPMMVSKLNEPATRVLSTQDPLVKIASDAVRSLWLNAPRLDPEQAAMALAPTISLVASALNGQQAEERETACASDWVLRQKIGDYISRRLHDSGLTPESIQNRFHVPRTKLYRLFPGRGIASMIRDARLRHAMRLLVLNKTRHLTITEIGARCGIESPSVFSRAFRARFGMSPSEARESGATRSTAPTTSTPDRIWEEWFANL